jgi:hypothetical protein
MTSTRSARAMVFKFPRPWAARRLFSLGLLVGSVSLAGCASSGPPSPRAASTEPAQSVARFLEAANTGDLEAMARIFGTADGPVARGVGNPVSCAFRRMGSWMGLGSPCTTWAELEVRMNLIALVLRHESYRLRGESQVPGRRRPTRRIGVDLDQGREQFADVPFLVVQTGDGRWLVEEVGLERITRGMP